MGHCSRSGEPWREGGGAWSASCAQIKTIPNKHCSLGKRLLDVSPRSELHFLEWVVFLDAFTWISYLDPTFVSSGGQAILLQSARSHPPQSGGPSPHSLDTWSLRPSTRFPRLPTPSGKDPGPLGEVTVLETQGAGGAGSCGLPPDPRPLVPRLTGAASRPGGAPCTQPPAGEPPGR